MMIDIENLFADIDRLNQFVNVLYDVELKKEAEREMKHKKEKKGGFYSPYMDGARMMKSLVSEKR